MYIDSPSGVFAEVTLVYRDKRYRSLDWTYPDYRSAAYTDILDAIRTLYRKGAAES